MENHKEPKVLAYRGVRWAGPPNSLPALERAMSEGAHGLAIDADVTSDGVLVATHDDLVRHQLGRRVRDLTWKELCSVRLSTPTGRVGVTAVEEILVATAAAAYVALVLPPDEDGRLVAELSRWPVPPTRLWFISPDLPVLGAAAAACPSGVFVQRVREGDRIPDWIDGFAASASSTVDVRAFASTPPRITVGIGCDSTLLAQACLASGYDAVLTARPGWLRALWAHLPSSISADRVHPFPLSEARTPRTTKVDERDNR